MKLPSIVILISEHDIVRAHLDNAVYFTIAYVISNGVSTYKVIFTIFIIFLPYTWSGINHRSSTAIDICKQLVENSAKLMMIFIRVNYVAIVRINLAISICSCFPSGWHVSIISIRHPVNVC